MWGSRKGTRDGAGITLVANNCEVVGDVCFGDQLLVNGVVKGNVIAREGSKASLTVSKAGEIHGEIRVPNIIVNGTVIGDIHSDMHIELAAEAKIKGNVYYSLIEMVAGSRVDGNLVHESEQSGVVAKIEKSGGEAVSSAIGTPQVATMEGKPVQATSA
jgi:cytoskeletal protein CcmA (bactofilin family)